MSRRPAAHPYNGLWAAIATMHGKENAIAPVLCRWFDMAVTTAPGIDTDALGTFTGEIERQGTPVDAARAKALLAIERTGAPIGIGSEGAFGPDPSMPFVATGLEVLLMRYTKTGHEIVVHRRTRTNFAHAVLSTSDDPSSFLEKCGFPEHAVVVRPEDPSDTSVLVKGLRNFDAVRRAIRDVASKSGAERIMLQTDMRAHLNPTRMVAIRRIAKLLATRIARRCPSCGIPGFGITEIERGVPCADCGVPTRFVVAEIHGCKSCGHTRRRFERSNRLRADPRWCQYCNP